MCRGLWSQRRIERGPSPGSNRTGSDTSNTPVEEVREGKGSDLTYLHTSENRVYLVTWYHDPRPKQSPSGLPGLLSLVSTSLNRGIPCWKVVSYKGRKIFKGNVREGHLGGFSINDKTEDTVYPIKTDKNLKYICLYTTYMRT